MYRLCLYHDFRVNPTQCPLRPAKQIFPQQSGAYILTKSLSFFNKSIFKTFAKASPRRHRNSLCEFTQRHFSCEAARRCLIMPVKPRRPLTSGKLFFIFEHDQVLAEPFFAYLSRFSAVYRGFERFIEGFG